MTARSHLPSIIKPIPLCELRIWNFWNLHVLHSHIGQSHIRDHSKPGIGNARLSLDICLPWNTCRSWQISLGMGRIGA
jgi:hypothetical protein